MKKVRNFLFVAFAMMLAASCSFIDPESKNTYNFLGTWHGSSDDMNSIRFYISSGSIKGTDGTSVDMTGRIVKATNVSEFYKEITEGQRGIIYIVDDGTLNWNGDIISAKIEYAEHIVTKGIYKTQKIDTLGVEGMDLSYVGTTTDRINGNLYVDMQFSFYTIQGYGHSIWLAEDLTKESIDSEGWCHLYLRHRMTNTSLSGGDLVWGLASFAIDEQYRYELNGLIIHYNSFSLGQESQVKVSFK